MSELADLSLWPALGAVEHALAGSPTAGLALGSIGLAFVLGAAHGLSPGHAVAMLSTAVTAPRSSGPREALAVAGSAGLAHVVVLLAVAALAVALPRTLVEVRLAPVLMAFSLGTLLLVPASVLHRRRRGQASGPGAARSERRSLALIGLAGGLGLSPWTWSVVLAATAYGAEALGLVLVLAYAVGLGSVLAIACLASAWCRRRWSPAAFVDASAPIHV